MYMALVSQECVAFVKIVHSFTTTRRLDWNLKIKVFYKLLITILTRIHRKLILKMAEQYVILLICEITCVRVPSRTSLIILRGSRQSAEDCFKQKVKPGNGRGASFIRH